MKHSDHDSVLAGLGDPDPQRRQLALIELEDLANEESVEPLIGVLNDSDPVVRRLAIGLLEELGDPRARLPGIISSLLDADAAVRDAARAALRDFRGEDTATHLLEAIDHPHAEVRARGDCRAARTQR